MLRFLRMVHLRRDCHTALHVRKYRPGTEKNCPGNKSVYIDAFYRPSVAFYGDIYGKILPKFDEENFEEAIKNREKGIILPTDSIDRDIEKGAYILVQEKVYNRWSKTQKAGLQLIWKKIRRCFYEKNLKNIRGLP